MNHSAQPECLTGFIGCSNLCVLGAHVRLAPARDPLLASALLPSLYRLQLLHEVLDVAEHRAGVPQVGKTI